MPTKRIIVHSGARPDVEYVPVFKSGEPHSSEVYKVDRDEEILAPEAESQTNTLGQWEERLAPSLSLVLPGGDQQFKPVAVSIESEEFDRDEPRDASAQENTSGAKQVRVKRRRITLLGTVHQKRKSRR